MAFAQIPSTFPTEIASVDSRDEAIEGGFFAAGSIPPDRAAYEPVPLRLTLCGLAGSPTALTPSVALSAPTMLGVNFSR